MPIQVGRRSGASHSGSVTPIQTDVVPGRTGRHKHRSRGDCPQERLRQRAAVSSGVTQFAASERGEDRSAEAVGHAAVRNEGDVA